MAGEVWRGLGGRLLLVLVGVAVGVVALWAGQATIGHRPETSQLASALTYTVAEDTVERSLPVIVVAERSRDLVTVNLLDGLVTRVPDLEGPASTGTVIYEVAGVPVRVVEGAVPFYRDLAPGLEGDDVSQLQAALSELGYLRIEPDGQFGTSTAAAVREWRRDLGLVDADRVALGELIAVPDLPRLVSVGDEIRVGRLAAVGLDALFVLSDQPRFELSLSDAQARALDPAATVVVEHDGMEWNAQIATSRTDPERGEVILMLAGLDGGLVCGEDCTSLPSEGRSQLRGRIVSVPPTTGPAVPVAALWTDADGTVSLRLESGIQRKVKVLATAGGLAIVEGVEIGDRVMVGGGPSAGDEDG